LRRSPASTSSCSPIFNGKRNFAPPAEVSDWFEIKSVDLRNGDNVGVVTTWSYPATKTGIAPEAADRILTEIGRGLENGQRYSNDNAATKRAAWKLVQKHCPDKPPKEVQAGYCKLAQAGSPVRGRIRQPPPQQ
jgi:hypothetical protein